jgi:hypothetical protein
MLKNLFRLEYNNNNLKNIYKLDMPSQVKTTTKKSKTGTNPGFTPVGSRKTINNNSKRVNPRSTQSKQKQRHTNKSTPVHKARLFYDSLNDNNNVENSFGDNNTNNETTDEENNNDVPKAQKVLNLNNKNLKGESSTNNESSTIQSLQQQLEQHQTKMNEEEKPEWYKQIFVKKEEKKPKEGNETKEEKSKYKPRKPKDGTELPPNEDTLRFILNYYKNSEKNSRGRKLN